MHSSLIQWAVKHSISPQALADLRAIYRLDGGDPMPASAQGVSEGAVQSVVRLEAGRKGLRLWRNNVGSLLDERGIPVRYGLGNDSKQLNAVIKSADLIGWRPVTIAPHHVGSVIAQFVSRECKKVGWKYKGDAHEQAQLKWAEIVVADGGDACFVTGEGTL